MEYFPIVLMLPLLWTNRNLALEDNSMQTEQNLYEESPAHTYIVEIAQAAGFSSNYSQEQMASLHFSLLPSSEHGDFFTVNPSSGALRTAQIIDRDDPELCAARVTCVLRLDIGIQIDGDFLLYKVFVNILDRNDNAPNFLQNSFSRSIAENTPPGASFSIPAAEDLDSPRFGVKDYALIEGAPQFELKKVNNSEGNLDIYLVLREELDHEVRNHYEALVAAYDGGVQPNIGRLPIDIVVEDVNDNHPYFEVENYQVRVPEDLEVGSLVTQVSAWDDDSGANGQIVYGFTVKTERSYGSIFAINNHTGTITVKSPLDYESHPTYNLAVTARDVNPDSLAATALVVVEVEDVNDHVPLITVSALTTSGNLQVAEDQAVGTFVAFVAVSDPDSGANGQFSCHLEGQAFAIEQLQDSSQFKLITSVELDRETLAHYDVSFVCQDGGIPSRSSTALIGITVLDINDHAPVFSKQLYSAQVTENNRLEEFIIKVEASDADAGDNGLIEYSVEGSGNMYISISPSTGDITARVSYDYEESPMMEFTLLVVDHGSPPRNGTAMLRINLRDLDDNIPTFGNHFYSLDIYENLPIGSTVGQVFASDADSAAFNQFTYGLVPGQSDYDPFQVHPDTGLIVTTQRLDRETTAFYEFLLTAVSSHNVSQSSLVTVRVDVADKNDNSPYLLFPTEHNNSLTIPSALNIGSEVGHIVARDEDIGINAQLAYMLMDGLQNYYFDLDYNTGVIRVKSSLRSVENSVVQLRILVRDHGQPYYQINEWLNIAVNKTLLVPLSNHNLTIVIAVVTVSGLLTVLLVAAIIITKRLDQRKQSNRYMPRLCPDSTNLVFMDGKTCSHENSLQDEGLKTAMYDASFTNEVLIEEAGMFRAPGHVSVEDKSASIRIQVSVQRKGTTCSGTHRVLYFLLSCH